MKACHWQIGDARRLILSDLIVICGLVVLSMTGADAARGQIVGSATAESQYDLRGITLDDGKPDIRLSLSYDHASGAYAGVSGLVGDTARNGVQPLGYLGYAGFAGELRSGLVWDVGATGSGVTLYLPIKIAAHALDNSSYVPLSTHRYHASYAEVYGGVSLRDLSARLYLSPDYLNEGVRTAYLDLTAAVRPVEHLRLYVHAGALTPLGTSSTTQPGSDREHFDLGLGGAWTFRHAELRLGWTGIDPRQTYPFGYLQRSNKIILSLTGFF